MTPFIFSTEKSTYVHFTKFGIVICIYMSKMNQGKSVQKTHTPKREPRPDKIRQNSKDEKEMERKKVVLTSSAMSNFKGEKHRSESLSRPRHPFKSQESPRKSHSVDRNQNSRQTSSVKTDIKTTIKNNTKTVKDISKKASSSTNSTRHKNNLTKASTDKSSTSSTSQKSKSSSRAPKIIERKNSVQVAKSFVKNVQSKSSKSSDKLKSDSKKPSKEKITKNVNPDINLDRPRTSTIRKGPSESINIDSEINYVTKETKTLKSSSSLSRSKASLNGESDNDKASYEEDFEDYDSDFEESDSASISESNSSESSTDDQEEDIRTPEEERVLVHNSSTASLSNLPIENNTPVTQNKNAAEKTFLKMSDRSSLYSKKNVSDRLMDKKPMKLSRSFINFSTAIEKNEKVNELNDTSEMFNEKSDDHISNEKQDITTNNYNYATYKSNLKQAFVQTENCEEEEVQTDEIEIFNKWTQNPTNGTSGCGGDEISAIRDKTAAWKSLFNVQSTKLTSFLQKSSNIILTLLDEEFTAFSNEYQMQKRPNFFYSDGYYILSPLNFLLGVPIISVCCSEDSPYIVTIHGNMAQLPSENGQLDEKGVICVWNISEYKKPEYILTANSQPTCGTFGPGGSDILVAGMVDGAVMLWDLTDLNTNYLQIELDVSLTLRSPTYNTALILGSENHSSCIVGIQTVCNREKDWRSSGSAITGSMKNFHVMTLEDMGVLIIWVVVEVLKPDISGLETDLGLAPGGKFRLVRSSSILLYNLPTLQVLQKTSIRTFDFRPVPFDPSRMLVSTDAGIVLHVTRHSGGVEPRFYGNETEFSAEIRCIDCSPHNEDLFLVGCSDGSIKLYNVKLVRPLSEFLQPAKGEPINLLKWSSVHPSVFCVLSSSSWIHLWNLMEDSVRPVQSYNFEDCKITWFVFKTMDQSSSQRSRNKTSYFIISKENGEVEVHTFQNAIHEVDYQKQLHYMNNL